MSSIVADDLAVDVAADVTLEINLAERAAAVHQEDTYSHMTAVFSPLLAQGEPFVLLEEKLAELDGARATGTNLENRLASLEEAVASAAETQKATLQELRKTIEEGVLSKNEDAYVQLASEAKDAKLPLPCDSPEEVESFLGESGAAFDSAKTCFAFCESALAAKAAAERRKKYEGATTTPSSVVLNFILTHKGKMALSKTDR